MERKDFCNCAICGERFKMIRPNQKYCSVQCGRKVWRGEKPGADDSGVAELVAKYNPEWEYIGGYTGSDGSMVVRHKCGFTTRKSCVTFRHNKRRVRCDLCEERERRKREKKAAAIKEAAKFYKPTKQHKQTEMQECPVCGCFFYKPGSKYCGDECAKETIKHYYNMKKGRRRRQSRTEESKSISLRKLYDRDNGVCWICGGLCDYTADGNADNYPSIDHVVPIAHGGKDEWKNIRLAHRLCNSLRGSGERAADPE